MSQTGKAKEATQVYGILRLIPIGRIKFAQCKLCQNGFIRIGL